MKRLAQLNIGIILALSAAFYVAYYLLLKDTFLHTSISDIISRSHQLRAEKHLLILGLLPVYIGTIIFGAATLGIYLGTLIKRLILNKSSNNPFRHKISIKI